MASFFPRFSAVLAAILHLFLRSPQAALAQQVGSFFTAIYLNGAPIASDQSSCSNMGQGQYCCGTGQSCAWDDTGHVACCPSGSSCQGSPYSSGASAGAYAQSSWQPSSSVYQVTPITTTVYPQSPTDCGCESTAAGGSVVPIVPITKATLATSYYTVPTSTYYPNTGSTTTTTIPAQGQGQVTTVVPTVGGQGVSTTGPVACATVSTITEANVGQPVRTVGCLIIFNEGSKGRDTEGVMTIMLIGVFGVMGALLS